MLTFCRSLFLWCDMVNPPCHTTLVILAQLQPMCGIPFDGQFQQMRIAIGFGHRGLDFLSIVFLVCGPSVPSVD